MIQVVRGTKDILPEQTIYWQYIEEKFRICSHHYGFSELRTPIFEKTDVFLRSIGEETDIVNKEMYTFQDKGGESITLRPEGTAALVRAIIQNGLANNPSINKLWYYGPFFRYERPQKGRMRQFYQYGAELIGSPNPLADIELLMLANHIFESLGIKSYKLLLNTLGTEKVRKTYREELIKYFVKYKNKLSEDSQMRIIKNPLRILDSKEPNDIELLEEAPKILDFLDDESKKHFDFVCEKLSVLDINYEISHKLVRGLDYYCHTVFEFQSDVLGSQDSFGGGGRYDGLFNQLGFQKEMPAVGFALGVERMLLILEALNLLPEINSSPKLYIVTIDSKLINYVINLARKLREKGISTVYDLSEKSVKAQFREANKLKAKYTIAIGQDELNSQNIELKRMSDSEKFKLKLNDLYNFNFNE